MRVLALLLILWLVVQISLAPHPLFAGLGLLYILGVTWLLDRPARRGDAPADAFTPGPTFSARAQKALLSLLLGLVALQYLHDLARHL